MRAWLLEELTGIEKLRLAEVPDPQVGEGEALLRVDFAALNPADRYLAEQQYPAKPPLPHILGRDASGVVLEVGPGVSSLKAGDRVVLLRGEAGVSRWGTFAEKVAVPAENVVTLPPGWTESESAGAPLVYLTAWQALTTWGELPPSVVLVSGASGGVGLAAVQIAKAIGHRVIALSRNEHHRHRLLQMGADLAIDPTEADWTRKLKQRLAPARVDLAIDNIGGKLLPAMIETLGENGMVSCVGRLAGEVPSFNTASLFFRRIRIGGVAVGAYTAEESRSAWAQIVRLLERTDARPAIDTIHAFEELPKAFEDLAGEHFGKILIAMQPVFPRDRG